MNYSLFWTDREVTEREYLAAKPKLIKAIYAELDDALGRAREIVAYGGVPWEIEGDDGIKLGRHEIVKTINKRRYELEGRPNVR